MKSVLASVVLSACLGLVSGCRAAAQAEGRHERTHESAPGAAQESAHGSTHDAESEPSSSPGASAQNRDPHGDPDVGRYVARLASPDRIAELRVAEVVAKLALAEDAIVGDLGCGPGIFAIPFARAAPEGFVLASDVEPGQLDALRSALEAEGVHNVVPVLSSYGDPHFPSDRLDVVFVGDTYHHLRDRIAYFRRLQRVLAPGGRLAILEYKPGKLPVGPAEDHKLPAGLREAELTEAGYLLVERFATHQYHDFETWRVVQPWEK